MFRSRPQLGDKSGLKATLELVRYWEAVLQGACPRGTGSGVGHVAYPFSDLCVGSGKPGSGFLSPSPVLLSHSQLALDLELNPAHQCDREHHGLPTPCRPAGVLLSKDRVPRALWLGAPLCLVPPAGSDSCR